MHSPELEGLWPVLICNGGDGRSTDQILGTRTTTLSRHAYDNVEQPRCPQCAAESGRPASGVRRRDSIGERREAGFVMGGGRMRRRELDYRTTCSVSFYFMGPSPPYLLGGARKSAKNILGWWERSWSTDQKIGRANL